MNTNLVALKITGAVAALRSIQDSLDSLPQHQRRMVAGSAHLATVIAGLEMAKAEVLGEAQPQREYSGPALDEDLLALIDN